MSFRCLKDGKCCRKYWIPLTHLDLLRLKIYGHFKLEKVVRLKDAQKYQSRRFPAILFKGIPYYLALREKLDGSCIFLEKEGTCMVHPYKPMVCRFYPFVYTVHADGSISISVNEKAIGECPGLILDDEPIDEFIAAKLKSMARIRLIELKLYEEVVREWNREAIIGDMTMNALIKFLIKRAEKHYKVLKEKGLWVK